MQITARTYGACPSLRMSNPLLGAGTGAPGGAGTSRRQDVSRPSGRLRQKNHPNPAQNLCKSARSTVGSPLEAVVRSRPCSGRHTRRDGACCRSPPSPWSSLRPLRSAWPSPSTQSASSLRAQNLQLAAKKRAAVLQLYSLDEQLSATQVADRVAEPARPTRCAPSARASCISSGSRKPRHAHRPDTARPPAAHALRAGERRAARDRVRREEPRRGAVEPRQPEPRHGPERGRPPPAEDGPGAAGRHLEQAGRTPARRSRAPPSRLRRTAAALAQTRAARASYISLARRPAAPERQPDLVARRRRAGRPGPDASGSRRGRGVRRRRRIGIRVARERHGRAAPPPWQERTS